MTIDDRGEDITDHAPRPSRDPSNGERAVDPQVVIVTGMSGAGRSTAARSLEDLEYRVIDNLPPHLIPAVIEHHELADIPRRLAVVVDARGGITPETLRESLDELEGQGIGTQVLFLDAEDAILLRRFTEARRPHPMRTGDLIDAIASERRIMADVKDMADVVIDTTELNVHELRRRLNAMFAAGLPERTMRVSVTSFGYKHGVPRDADLLFDVRFLPNPHWQPELRPLRGTDGPVSDYVLGQPDARTFLEHVQRLLTFLIPRFKSEGKSYLSIGIGCTGGHHRSVALAENIADWLGTAADVDVLIRHRDIDR